MMCILLASPSLCNDMKAEAIRTHLGSLCDPRGARGSTYPLPGDRGSPGVWNWCRSSRQVTLAPGSASGAPQPGRAARGHEASAQDHAGPGGRPGTCYLTDPFYNGNTINQSTGPAGDGTQTPQLLPRAGMAPSDPADIESDIG